MPVTHCRQECEQRGATIIYATHIFDGLDRWMTHLAHVSDGELIRGGSEAAALAGPLLGNEAAVMGLSCSPRLNNKVVCRLAGLHRYCLSALAPAWQPKLLRQGDKLLPMAKGQPHTPF